MPAIYFTETDEGATIIEVEGCGKLVLDDHRVTRKIAERLSGSYAQMLMLEHKHQFGMAARVPFGACTGTLGTIEATADVGERTSSVSPLHLEQTSLEPLPFGVDQPLCLRNGKVALLRSDLRSNKQCPGIPVQILFDIEIEGRASPTAPIVRTGAAAALETLGIAETGYIIGDGNRHAEIFGSVWDHISVKRSN
jgi:hypothetical protein